MLPRFMFFVTALMLWVFTGYASSAEDVPGLYQASSIVTGRDRMEERVRGTQEAFAAVLAKVSGDRQLPQEPAAKAAFAEVETYVVSRHYTDRKAGIQISDEQGTRDRSFVLDVSFDKFRVDTLLRALGRKPWGAHRPSLLVQLRVTDSQTRYLVTATSERGWGQREVIQSLRDKAGLPLSVPNREADAIDPRHDGVLAGSMRLRADGYWDTEWHLMAPHVDETWTVPHTTFDRAIADGVWKAARMLSQTP